MATVSIPGYQTVTEVADRLGVSSSRVRQLLMTLRTRGVELGYLVGTVRLFSPQDVATIEEEHTAKRKYEKSGE